jgi:hypothetical protein
MILLPQPPLGQDACEPIDTFGFASPKSIHWDPGRMIAGITLDSFRRRNPLCKPHDDDHDDIGNPKYISGSA